MFHYNSANEKYHFCYYESKNYNFPKIPSGIIKMFYLFHLNAQQFSKHKNKAYDSFVLHSSFKWKFPFSFSSHLWEDGRKKRYDIQQYDENKRKNVFSLCCKKIYGTLEGRMTFPNFANILGDFGLPSIYLTWDNVLC